MIKREYDKLHMYMQIMYIMPPTPGFNLIVDVSKPAASNDDGIHFVGKMPLCRHLIRLCRHNAM